MESAGGRYNAIAPTQEVLTVRSSPEEEAEKGEREALMMRWGLVPRWAKDLKVGYKMINAKTERLTESRAYAPLIGKFRHRCLIVADGFYEWLKSETRSSRASVPLHRRRRRAVCLRRNCTARSGRTIGFIAARSSRLTPNEVVKPVHDRMPVILPAPRRSRPG
jgi:putative SOS response-associated peptidase YedK